MDKKFLITLSSTQDADNALATGCTLLARYDDGLLVRANEEQANKIRSGGLEATELEQLPIQMQGGAFAFANALEANHAAPIKPADSNRKAYYLLQMVGPAKGEWLEALSKVGVDIQGNLPGYSLLIGALPVTLGELSNLDWVENVTPYRPTMKVAPQLRGALKAIAGPGIRMMNTAELANLDVASADPTQQVEVTVFPGESTSGVAAKIRETGGVVLSEAGQKVTAIASPKALEEVAQRQGVQAILPHSFPKFHNDVATRIMGVPTGNVFGTNALKGTGEIVAVADSGLDTGDPVTIHPDFDGRVIGMESLPAGLGLARFTKSPAGSNDGPADVHSGHGTHVAGSALGNGAAGNSTKPQGTAPEASLFFQAVEQSIQWKSRQQMIQDGIGDPGSNWPPAAVGLYGLPDSLTELFDKAYARGSRIHTNSWGSSDPSTFGQYNANSADVDRFMSERRDMLILFAAGNDGVDDDGDGMIDAGSVTPPGTAKNCLTVGASENQRPPGGTPVGGIDGAWDELGIPPRWPTMAAAGHVSDKEEGMAAFSSRGPTDEGRIKPDVVAPGTNVLSVRSRAFVGTANAPEPLWGDLPTADPLFNHYCWSGGTSMSTPLVAGAAAVVRQYLVVQRGHHQDGVKPSGALVKAFLIHGAVPIGGNYDGEVPQGPNPVSGFGRVNLAESLTPATGKALFDDEPDHAVGSQQIRRFRVRAANPGQAIKVTLTWTDPPSPVGQGSLENSLYLQVVTPSNQVRQGDVSPYPIATNNVQQVSIDAAEAGDYEIRVRGISVVKHSPGASNGTSPRQDFALVVTNASSLSLVN